MLTDFKLSLFFIFIFFCFIHYNLFNHSIYLFIDGLVIFSFYLWIFLKKRNFSITICHQTSFFSSFPILFKCLDDCQYESFLIICELSILTHRIQTDNEFLFTANKWSKLNFGPFFFFFFKWFISSLSSLKLLCLLIFKNIDFFLLFCFLICNWLIITDGCF